MDYLYYSSTIRLNPPSRSSLPLGLMGPFQEFKELPPIPPVDTIGYSGTLSLAGAGGDLGMGGGDSLVKGSNPHPVSKSGCPRKELLEGDWDRREILC